MNKFNRTVRFCRNKILIALTEQNGTFNRCTFNTLMEPLNGIEPYGKASEIDFPNSGRQLANLICYNDKQYYCYKDLENPNLIGYFSRKQYYKFSLRIKKMKQTGAREQTINNFITDYSLRYGTKASLERLLKRATESNPKARFLKRVSRAGDGALLRRIAKEFLTETAPLRIMPCESAQEAYDIIFKTTTYGSGKNYAVKSCMQLHKVGEFYDKVGAKAYIIYKGGEKIGRFLVWKMANGKIYVDRLYIQGEFAEAATSLLKKTFVNAEFYGEDFPSSYIKIPDGIFSEYQIEFPYIDTFFYLKGGFMGSRLLPYQAKGGLLVRNISRHEQFACCPFCGRSFVLGYGYFEHLRICKTIKNKTKNFKEEFLQLIKEYEEIENENDF